MGNPANWLISEWPSGEPAAAAVPRVPADFVRSASGAARPENGRAVAKSGGEWVRSGVSAQCWERTLGRARVHGSLNQPRYQQRGRFSYREVKL